MKKIYILLLFFCNLLYGQMQTAHWYFGEYAGIDFSSGIPVSDNNGQIDTKEGSTSISDEYGNLLFYTDGVTVFNRNHVIMENGDELHGHSSSTTSAIVLPVPEDCNLYYIFTIGAQYGEAYHKGLRYNVVDMTLDGGFGAITQKNIEVPINGMLRGYEKLAAVSNADKTGYWIITHLEGYFYAFEVTSNGVNMVPVVSPSTINPVALPGVTYVVGFLKASPDGSKLGMANHHDQRNDIAGSLSVYDFNNSTGVVSNEVLLYPPGNSEKVGFYAVEFSADSRAMYSKTFKSAVNSKILQYDLTASSIPDSEYVVAYVPMTLNAMQRALDGSIYIVHPLSHYIARVENPEIIYDPVTGEAPTYNPNAVYIDGLGRLGLPTFLNFYFRISITVDGLSIDEDLEYCTGVSMSFDFCHQGGIIESIHWDFGDGQESTEMYPQHYYNEPGTYTITLTIIVEGEEFIRTFEINIMGPVGVEDAEQSICLNEGEEYTFNLEDSLPDINPEEEDYDITFHLTQEDAENGVSPQPPLYTAGETTIIWIRAEDDEGCFVIRELHLIINFNPELSFESPVEICTGTSAVIEITTDAENIVFWYDSENGTEPIFNGNPLETPILNEEESYWVEVQSPEGCISERVEIKVEVTEPTTPVFDLELEYCLDSPEVVLPTISDNGITGSWDPEIVDTSSVGVQTYTFTPDEEMCSEILTIEIEIKENIIPEFEVVNEYCLDSIPEELPDLSDNGITGSWTPSSIDTSELGIFVYLFTPDEGQCAEEFELEIEVTDNVLPIFDLSEQYCLDSEPEELPTISNNGISGIWSPSTIDTSTLGSQTYIFIPDEGQCSDVFEMEIEIIEAQTPVFNLQEQYCQGEEADVLFTESDNGILGTWFPEFIDTETPGTTTYIFTPDADECAVPFEIEITVLETLIAEFNLQTVYCLDAVPVALPVISDNGIPGNWMPSTIDTSIIGSTTYIFTPDGECVEEYILEVEITDSIIPAFNLQQQYCLDSEPQELPTTSNNGIVGNWSPSTIDTSTVGTQTYIFTPDEGQCAEIYQTEIEVSEIIEPVFIGLPESYCLDSEAELLPEISDNGISGSWFPSEINTGIQGTTVYVFTPEGEQCSEEYEFEITIYPHPEMDLEEDIVICAGDSYTYTAPEGFDYYIWRDSNGNILSETPEVTFTEEGVYTLTVEINGIPCDLSRNIEVSFSTAPVILEIETTESTLTVHATGTGPFEYSLDNVFWQSSNVFYNLEPGIYYVYVRDRKGCGTEAKQAGILGVPNFISPNEDGKNDTWKIRALEAFPNTRLQIFDRYGKMFVDRILEGDFEWDGKYNREPLPSGTYWYILILENGEKLNGHINLRNY